MLKNFIELMKLFDPIIVAAVFSFLGSLVIAAVTYVRTQQLKFFDVYFCKKATAYESFIDALSEHQVMLFTVESDDSGWKADGHRLIHAFMVAKLYCSKEALAELDKIGDCLGESDIETVHNLARQSDKAISIFRKDLQRCRKYKFQ